MFDCFFVVSLILICLFVNVLINDVFNCWGSCWENDVSFLCDLLIGLILGGIMDLGNCVIFDFCGIC